MLINEHKLYQNREKWVVVSPSNLPEICEYILELKIAEKSVSSYLICVFPLFFFLGKLSIVPQIGDLFAKGCITLLIICKKKFTQICELFV